MLNAKLASCSGTAETNTIGVPVWKLARSAARKAAVEMRKVNEATMNAPHLQGFAHDTGLSDLQRRCLDKRIDECAGALAEAVCALREAEASEPRDVNLHALCGLLRAAHGLTALAHVMCGEHATRRDDHPIAPPARCEYVDDHNGPRS